MRTIALSLTMGGLILAVARIAAGNDFDILLQDLSFGGPSEAVESVAANTSPESFSAEDEARPEGLLMPAPPVAERQVEMKAIPPLAAYEGMIERSDSLTPPQPARDVDFDAVFTSQEARSTDDALADVETIPAPAEQAPAAPQPEPMPLSAEPMVAAPITDPVHMGGCNSCGVHHGCGCDNVVTCIPHLKPNLPHSTMLQYFRSNKCNSNVWDGYQQKCGLGHHHVRGTCDCFDPHRKSCFGAGHSHCGGCDTCDR